MSAQAAPARVIPTLVTPPYYAGDSDIAGGPPLYLVAYRLSNGSHALEGFETPIEALVAYLHLVAFTPPPR